MFPRPSRSSGGYSAAKKTDAVGDGSNTTTYVYYLPPWLTGLLTLLALAVICSFIWLLVLTINYADHVNDTKNGDVLTNDTDEIPNPCNVPNLCGRVGDLEQCCEENSQAIEENFCPRVLPEVAVANVQYNTDGTSPNGFMLLVSQTVGMFMKHYLYVARSNLGTPECNTLIPTTPGTQPLQPTGFDIIDVTDPEAPAVIAFVQGPINGSLQSWNVIENVNTPYFTGRLLVAAYESCRAFSPDGLILYNINNATTPIAMGPLFGDSAPIIAGNVNCASTSGLHRVVSPFGYAQGSQAFVNALDLCDNQVTFTSQADKFNITNPAAPVLYQEWENRDNSQLAWNVPVLPVPYNGADSVPSDTSEFYLNGTRPFAFVAAGDNGWATIDLSNPLNYSLVAESTWPSGGDWLNQAVPSAGNAACGRRSPVNSQFIVARHFDNGNAPPQLIVEDGPNRGSIALTSEHPNNQLKIAAIGNLRCGPTIYVGYACPGSPFEPVPLRSSLPNPPSGEDWIAVAQRGPVNDPNYPVGPCAYGDKMTNIVNAGYTAALYPNHHANSQPPANSIDTIGNVGLGNAAFPNTIAFSTTHHAQMWIFNLTTDGDLLPYPLKNSSLYREPFVGQIGARICLFGSTFRNEAGYWHLLNSTTMAELAHFMPQDARNQPSVIENSATRSAESCPSLHKQSHLAAIAHPWLGLYLLRYGGHLIRPTSSASTFRLVDVAQVLPEQSTGGLFLTNPIFLYKPLSGGGESTYLAGLEQTGFVHFYRVPDCLLDLNTTSTNTTATNFNNVNNLFHKRLDGEASNC